MKAIFQKEWREHFKVAVVGLAIFSFFLALTYWNCDRAFKQLARGEQFWQINFAQPLLAGETFVTVVAFCGVFGALLGWLQIHSERHRDLWAFLVHRPVTRTEIFCGKALAGLCLYAVGAGGPLLVFIILVWWPGHFAAPFEWAMVLPVLAFFLSGMIFYFAGLLTSVRHARWFASRGLGLAAGIVMTMMAVNVPFFWQTLLIIIVSAAVMAAAACGSFNSHGFYEGQPPLNRRALVVALMLGCFALFALLLLVVITLGLPLNQWTSKSTDYEMTSDGTIYKVVSYSSTEAKVGDLNIKKQTKITDLKGIPLKDKSGRPMTAKDFASLSPQSVAVSSSFNARAHSDRSFFNNSDFFSLWQQTPDTLWYWERNGRLWAYDIASRRFIGSLGPNGFAPEITFGPGRFNPPPGLSSYGGNYGQSHLARTLTANATVYKLDLENSACHALFVSTNDEPVLGTENYTRNGNYDHWDGTIVVTKSSVQMITPDGQCLWQIPFEPAYPAYTGVTVSFLKPTNQFAVWFSPNGANRKLPTRVVWLAQGRGILKSTNIPPNQYTTTGLWINHAMTMIVPPAFYFIAPLVSDNLQDYRTLPWKDVKLSFAVALVCAVVGWGLGRRHYFSAGLQIKWALFHLFFGLPGLLAMICAQEWALRVSCPHCKKPRPVDRALCVHCGAEFAPPPKIGTEIFETTAS